MKIETTELKELLDFTTGLARGAGDITLRYFRRTTAELKTDGSFVTAADRESERYLRAGIEERFPEDAILGEEEGEKGGSSGRRWIIDPIDGTFSFVHGVPLYGVLIGLEIDGEPVLGVTNIPALNEIVYAARGCGCYWNGERARVSSTAFLSNALLLSTEFNMYGFTEAVGRLQGRVATRRTWGDCYGHLLVATGRADIMLDPMMNIWDCAALLPILEEAGGSFTNWRGERTINGGNAISTNGLLFNEVFDILK